MSEIITSLPVDVTTNNEVKIGTRDRDIISASIKAPDINRNLLTQEYVMNNCIYSNLNSDPNRYGTIVEKTDDCFHYNFSRIGTWGQLSQASIIKIPLNVFNIKPNTQYTVSFYLYNMNGSYISNGVSLIRLSLRTDQGEQILINDRYAFKPIAGIMTHTFTTSITAQKFYYIDWYIWNWVQKCSLTFDLKVLSLVEDSQPYNYEIKDYNSYFKQSVITSNENNTLGSYQLSPYIRKHIQTVEHNIIKQENLYDITWR